jgi:hypothetical protein
VNRFLPLLLLFGVALYADNAPTTPGSICSTGETEVTLRVSPPPPKTVSTPQAKGAPGFEVVRLLVPKNLDVSGSIEDQAGQDRGRKAAAPMSHGE